MRPATSIRRAGFFEEALTVVEAVIFFRITGFQVPRVLKMRKIKVLTIIKCTIVAKFVGNFIKFIIQMSIITRNTQLSVNKLCFFDCPVVV